jgi:hypothetical protein
MLGSEILDVAIGLVLVFLLMSLMATAVREAIESFMKSRAVYLERGIREMLADPKGDGMAKAFYEHPLISSLFQGTFVHKEKRVLGGGLPTYIPAKNFAQAIMDLAIRGPIMSEYAAAQSAPQLSVATLRENAIRLKNPQLVRAVLAAIDHSEGDLTKARENIQAWFDSSMDRVSGWYKRATHFWLFAIGMALAMLFNVNVLRIADRLWRDKSLRESIAARAEAIGRDSSYQRLLKDSTFRQEDVKRVSTELAALTVPIGWPDSSTAALQKKWEAGVAPFFGSWIAPIAPAGAKPEIAFWLLTLLGFLPAALAITLGAPFWFDALNKIMVIRSTVKPHEKSPEESSEDRQKDSKGVPTVNVMTRAGAGGRRTDRAPATSASIVTAGAAAAGPDPDHVPHEWAVGEPDEGVI